MRDYFSLLVGIFQGFANAGDAFIDPVDEEIRRRTANPSFPITDLDIERSGRREAESTLIVSQGANEEPTTFAKANRAGTSGSSVIVDGAERIDVHRPYDLPILDDLQLWNVIVGGQ